MKNEIKLDFTPAEWRDLFENCDFTDRQKEIIALKRRGMFNVDIAEELYISRSTIDREIKKIRKKILQRIRSI